MPRSQNLEYLTLFRCWKCRKETDWADAKDAIVLDEARKVLVCSKCRESLNVRK